MKTAAIVNPRSAGGKTARRWPSLRQAIETRLGPVESCFTKQAGHATGIARDLLGRGFDRIIGVGGDGTFNEIANGFLVNDEPVRPSACLGLLPMGTGGDFQHSLEIPVVPAEAIELIAAGVAREIDVGRATFETHAGQQQQRYFVNLTSFGMGGEVSARARNAARLFGGKAAFFYATLRVFLTYRGKPVEITFDETAPPRRYRILNVAVGNGRFHGGGMYVCPKARFNSGLLEITVIEDLSLFTLLRDYRYLYDGNIYDHPKCHHFLAKSIRATSPVETRIEVDGEPLGRLPLAITVLPRRMKVLAPPGISLPG